MDCWGGGGVGSVYAADIHENIDISFNNGGRSCSPDADGDPVAMKETEGFLLFS